MGSDMSKPSPPDPCRAEIDAYLKYVQLPLFLLSPRVSPLARGASPGFSRRCHLSDATDSCLAGQQRRRRAHILHAVQVPATRRDC
jgi:hypothetical protein